MKKTPTMFDTDVSFEGITLNVDSIDKPGTGLIMPIFQEEQPFTWEFSLPYIREAISESEGSVDFLDVGTGCGVFGILMNRILDANVLAIDRNPLAIERARSNAKANGCHLILKNEIYGVSTVPTKSAKVIGIYPPYHLYPEEVGSMIPFHARGGSDGQAEFKNQLTIANHHLASNGVLFFNQMCLGTKKGPAFLDYVPELMKECSLTYTNVLEPIDTREFLTGVYGKRHPEYVERTAKESPMLYYCVGIIGRDGTSTTVQIAHDINLHGRSWNDRIQLHREIANHEFD